MRNEVTTYTQTLPEDRSSLETTEVPAERHSNYWAQSGKELIDREYSFFRTVEEIASLLGISSGHFRVNFRTAYGVSPKSYLTDAKIREAKKLLENQSIRIYDIATKVGFPSCKAFAAYFKELVGVTPSQYREICSTLETDLRK